MVVLPKVASLLECWFKVNIYILSPWETGVGAGL